MKNELIRDTKEDERYKKHSNNFDEIAEMSELEKEHGQGCLENCFDDYPNTDVCDPFTSY